MVSGNTSIADMHGQLQFNYRHPDIKDGQETEFLLRAFEREFEVNGPSVIRIVRTVLRGWRAYQHHPDARIRARFAHEAAALPMRYSGVLWAARRYYRSDPHRRRLISQVLAELHAEFGWRSRMWAPVVGQYLYRQLLREQQRLARGWTYEPPTFFEVNAAANAPRAVRLAGVDPAPSPPTSHIKPRPLVAAGGGSPPGGGGPGSP